MTWDILSACFCNTTKKMPRKKVIRNLLYRDRNHLWRGKIRLLSLRESAKNTQKFVTKLNESTKNSPNNLILTLTFLWLPVACVARRTIPSLDPGTLIFSLLFLITNNPNRSNPGPQAPGSSIGDLHTKNVYLYPSDLAAQGDSCVYGAFLFLPSITCWFGWKVFARRRQF